MAKNPVPKNESENKEPVTEVMSNKAVRSDANNNPNAINPNTAILREDQMCPVIQSAKPPEKAIGGGIRKDN